jgi:hypothetical protein
MIDEHFDFDTHTVLRLLCNGRECAQQSKRRMVGRVLKIEGKLELLAHERVPSTSDGPPQRVRAIVPHFFDEPGYSTLRCRDDNLLTVSTAEIFDAIKQGLRELPLNPASVHNRR